MVKFTSEFFTTLIKDILEDICDEFLMIELEKNNERKRIKNAVEASIGDVINEVEIDSISHIVGEVVTEVLDSACRI